MSMKIGEYLDRVGKSLTSKTWNKFGKDISKLKLKPEEWKFKIAQMEEE